MKSLADCLLYTFIDTGYLNGRESTMVARQLVDGGSDIVQLRAKGLSLDAVRRLADALWPVLEPAGVPLVINDHPQVALQVGAPYCHLGQEDFFQSGYTITADVVLACPDAPARKQRLGIGLSSHAPEQAQRAVRAGADYIAIGPVYATGTKPSAQPVTLEYVRWAARHVAIPWFAIGGINLDNLDAVLSAGARRICVVSAILTDPDPMQACQRFKDRLLSAGRDHLPTLSSGRGQG
jgi:thiamine-phosphate pyrophosphorylase